MFRDRCFAWAVRERLSSKNPVRYRSNMKGLDVELPAFREQGLASESMRSVLQLAKVQRRVPSYWHCTCNSV